MGGDASGPLKTLIAGTDKCMYGVVFTNARDQSGSSASLLACEVATVGIIISTAYTIFTAQQKGFCYG